MKQLERISVCIGICSDLYFPSRAPTKVLPDYGFEKIPHVRFIFAFSHFQRETIKIPIIGGVRSKHLGDFIMALLVLPVSISLLFLHDNLLTLRQALLFLGITAFFRPLTFCCTSLSDPCPSAPPNQYPI